MKVLMFGWEFPPHISGGLGTACAGLTYALEKENVHILFAVPKLHGEEQAERTTFLSASNIPIFQEKTIVEQNEEFSSDLKKENAPYGQPALRPNFGPGQQTRLEIPSYLSPYTSGAESVRSFDLERWNYSFDDPDEHTVPANLRQAYRREAAKNRGKQMRIVKEPYAFSGSYGPDLLQEVQRYARAGAEIARQHSFDVIHAHDWMTYLAGIEAKKISGKPLVVHVHATEIDRSGAHVNAEIFAIEKKGMEQADKVVTVSHWTKAIAVKHYHIAEKKIEVIHNGITPKHEDAVAKPLEPPVGSQIVTFLGRITHQKGPMYFVEAARKVHAQFPDAHFVVAGSGDQLPQMIERIAQVRLSAYFHFTGFLKANDIDRIWAMSHVYVMPSVSEPFGIAPLEAIQAGVPVILSKQAGVSEVMPHAIKVDFWNTEALAEAICNVLRFKSLANTLKQNGSEQIKNITWDKAAKKLTALYYELSSKHEERKKPGILFSSTPTAKTAHTPVF
jgi:glycogen(starch) synthase